MKTPEELASEEKVSSERMRIELETVIESLMEKADANKQISSKGGRISISKKYNPEDWAIVTDLFKRKKWQAACVAVEESCWSMTSKSEYTYTKYFIELTPLP